MRAHFVRMGVNELSNFRTTKSFSFVWQPLSRMKTKAATAAGQTNDTHVVAVAADPTFHPDSPFTLKYDFDALCAACPELNKFVTLHPVSKEMKINFGDPAAARMLNRALLARHYGIQAWDLPDGFLCPPVPSRAEYIYHLRSELLNHKSGLRVLDIGCGASCIYPIIATGIDPSWEVTGTETNASAVAAAERIASSNPQISVRHQLNPSHIFRGVMLKSDIFDVAICKPPEFRSQKEALRQLERRSRFNSKVAENDVAKQSFEMWCEGGEKAFVARMIRESARKEFRHTVGWFTTLVARKKNMPLLQEMLAEQRPDSTKVITMKFGSLESRILCWSFRFKSG